MKQTALITGASRGIGRAIALEFARAGYDLVLTCKNNIGLLEDVRHEAMSHSVQCNVFAGDLAKESTVLKLFSFINEKNIPIDVLINNAGISHFGLLQDTSLEQWHQIIDTNLTSVFLLSKHVLPSMIKQKQGKIINVSSVWGLTGASYEVAYSASKGGLNSFTKALAKELAPSNIQVNAVACGAIDTQMNEFLQPDELRGLQDSIPVGRLGKTSEVADLILKLARSSSYLTGQIITLDGGWI